MLCLAIDQHRNPLTETLRNESGDAFLKRQANNSLPSPMGHLIWGIAQLPRFSENDPVPLLPQRRRSVIVHLLPFRPEYSPQQRNGHASAQPA